MAWLGKLTVSDFTGAVNKLSESVKNIEKNFDSALGFESSESREGRPAGERAASVFESLLPPSILAKATSETILSTPTPETTAPVSATDLNAEAPGSLVPEPEVTLFTAEVPTLNEAPSVSESKHKVPLSSESTVESMSLLPSKGQRPLVDLHVSTQSIKEPESIAAQAISSSLDVFSSEDIQENGAESRDEEGNTRVNGPSEDENVENSHLQPSPYNVVDTPVNVGRNRDHVNGVNGVHHEDHEMREKLVDVVVLHHDNAPTPAVVELVNGVHAEVDDPHGEVDDPQRPPEVVELRSFSGDAAGVGDEKLSTELKMMEAALQGAARQAQMKADEISRLMVENEQLKAALEELKRKASDVELDALREEYQQRLGAAERKVYALTKERDMLRREQNRKSDSSILLKEKDEIIKQVMAEGEELSKKQAAQEGLMKKLRAQIRELEDEKNRLTTKLQVEEAKVESIRKDKAATEKALQESVERGQAESAAQKEFYSHALNEAREAAALAEARVDSEARADLDRRLREASERESTLVQNIDQLRQALTRTEQQAAVREDTLRCDIEDLEKRCQAAEVRYEELVARIPDSTRPLRRQIEALQEQMTMRAEAWSGAERILNSRLQQAEAKAAAAQERERAVNERVTQTLSRMAVMEAQVSCLRAEQAQLTRSLEKERQRASENRQEYLASTEAAATHEGRALQLEEEIKAIRRQYKQDLNEEKARRESLEQEIEQERTAMADYEKRIRAEGRAAAEKAVAAAQPNELSMAKSLRRSPSMSSQSSMEESFFLQSSLDTMPDRVPGHSDRHSGRFSFSDRPPSPSPHFGKTTYEQLESHLRQKEGEVASYAARLAALESTRDSLADELVKATTQCESLGAEATLLPGMRAELESLRGRHTSALELMGERDEEVEELRADLADVKQMYREQIDLLVGQIERLSAAVGSR